MQKKAEKPDLKDPEAFNQLKLTEAKDYFCKSLPKADKTLKKDKMLKYLQGIKDFGKTDPSKVIDQINSKTSFTEDNLKSLISSLGLQILDVQAIYSKFYADQV